MDNKNQRTKMIYKGREISIHLFEIYGEYEVLIYFESNGEEIESKKFPHDEYGEALRMYNDCVVRYSQLQKPLTGKYAKLRDDLKVADRIGCEAASKVKDSGTSNFDSASLYLPGWKEAFVKRAAEEAGIRCFKWDCYGAKRFVFGTSAGGRAYKRSKASEAMVKSLASAGYEAFEYCQMD